MRTTVPVLQQTRGVYTFRSKICLVLLGCLFGFFHTVYAGGKPGVKLRAKHADRLTLTANSLTTMKAAGTIDVPSISYSTPPVYAAGTAIATLTPTSSGVAPLAFSPTPAILGSGFSLPSGVAEDGGGNIYIADAGTNRIKELAADGSTTTLAASGFNDPVGIAIQAKTNTIYVADYNNNQVKKILEGATTPVVIGSGFLHPSGVAVDSLGNVYVADSGNSQVKEIMAITGTIVVLGSGFVTPVGIAVDPSGNVFVADAGNNTVKKIPAGGGTPVTVGSGFNAPNAVAIDYSGNLYVSDSGNNQVKMYVGGAGSPIVASTGLNGPAGVCATPGGVIVADQLNNSVKSFSATGGYFLFLSLPAGLKFSSQTGAISGTPIKGAPSAVYSVEAINASGVSGGNVTIEVDALTISYPGPQVFKSGAGVSVLPTAARVAAPGYNNSFLTIAKGFTALRAVAADKNGNIYVADEGAPSVTEFPANGGVPIPLGSGWQQPNGIAVDTLGNVYVADEAKHSLIEVPANNGAMQNIGSGFSPYSVTIDPRTGYIYLVEAVNDVYRIDPVTHAATQFITGLNFPSALAVTSNAIYIININSKTIRYYDLNGNYEGDFAAITDEEYGILADEFDNLFIADTGTGLIKEYLTTQNAPVNIGSGLTNPYGIAIDGIGNVYVSDETTNLLKKIAPSGGYFINPQLPPGLRLNNTTGEIGGYPQAPAAAKNYTITAYNSYGSNSATITITISPLSISYATPQTYTAGKAITPLYPTTAGVAGFSYQEAPSTYVYALPANGGPIVVDAAGHIYMAFTSYNLLAEGTGNKGYTLSGGNYGLNGPTAMVVSTSGDIYVADAGNKRIVKIPGGTTTAATFAQGFGSIDGVAVDDQGDVFSLDKTNEEIYKYPADGTARFLVGQAQTPTSIAADVNGDLFITDAGDNTLKEVIAGGTKSVILQSGIYAPIQVTLDPGGDIFVVDGQNEVYEVEAGDTELMDLDILVMGSIAVDGKGTLYTCTHTSGQTYATIPIGGYYLSKTLPAGLNFFSNNGAITGTPVGLSAAANYTVTAYNPYSSNSAALTIKVNLPPAPVISYTSPQTFTANTAVMFSSAASGVAAPAYSTNAIALGAGFINPIDIALDAAGNIYVIDGQSLKKMTAGGSTPTVVNSTLTDAGGVTVDAAGNIYIANGTSILKIPAGGGVATSIGPNFSSLGSIAIDAAGNIYVLDIGVIKELLAGSNIVISLSPQDKVLIALTVTPGGDIYYVSESDASVGYIPANRGSNTIINNNFSQPRAIALDEAGDLFVSDYTTGLVQEIYAGTTTLHPVGPVSFPALGLAVDAAGNIYSADYDHGAVRITKPTGGYFINKPLPAGLNINTTTGTISGHASVLSPATDYSVVAYNLGGSSTATVNIQVTAPPAPTISYSAPAPFYQGIPITSPTLTASANIGQPGYSGSSAITLGSGFTSPHGIARDTAGNLYVVNLGNHTIYEIPAGSNTPIVITSAITNPIGIASDAAGNLYVVNQGHGIDKIAVGGSPVVVGTGLSGALGVAVDAAGNLFVTDATANSVKEIAAASGTITTIATGFNLPQGISVDAAGNIFVADRANNLVKEIPAGSSTPVVIGVGFDNPFSVTADAFGNVFVADGSTNSIKEINVAANTTTTISSGLVTPTAVAVDAIGNVYLTDAEGASGVKKVAPTGGFYVKSAFPAGFSFNNSTGALTGIPTATSSSATYSVTAYNIGGSATALLKFAVTAPPAPTLKYTTPQNLIINTAIAPLLPTSTNVASAAYSGTPTVAGTGILVPGGVASDALGNIFVADNAAGKILEIPVSGATVTIASGFNNIFGIAVDAAGNVYVADANANTISKVPLSGTTYGTPVTLGSGFSTPYGVAVDAAGNVYVGDTGNNAVKKMTYSGGVYSAPVSIGSGFTQPYQIALDAAGNIFIADGGNNALKKIAAGSNTATIVLSGFSNPTGVAVDAMGNIFVADFGHNLVRELPVNSSRLITIGSGFSDPIELTVDPYGRVYVADFLHSAVKKIVPIGGYFINKTLPAGLSIDNNSGTVSGMPTVLSAASNYIVTAYNVTGSAKVGVSIAVTATSNVATLSNLAISSGTLSPVFATGTTAYTASVASSISSITVTPTATSSVATLKVNGTAVVSGHASAAIPLVAGPNTISTVVTAQDGTTTKTYTVTITRAKSTNASLAGLALSKGTLTPAFATATLSYSDMVTNGTTSLTVTPTLADATATATVNGTAVASGHASGAIALAVGTNTITTIVTAQDGSTKKTYSVSVIRPSTNAKLSALTISAGTLTPAFNTNTTSYTASVTGATASITLTPTVAAAGATVKVNGTAVASGAASGAIALAFGSNTINTVITAQDGATTATYTITVTRTGSTNANLAGLVLSKGTLTPAFAAATISYTDMVTNGTTSLTVTPTVADATATVTVNGTAVTSGHASGAITLVVGNNAVTTVVTAQDGATTQTYTVNVIRPSTNAKLSALTISVGTLSPVFNTNTTSYTASLNNTTTSIKVTPTVAATGATIKVNGTAVTSGSASAAIALSVGSNTITTVVTAQDGATTVTYTLTVTRSATGANIPDAAVGVTVRVQNFEPLLEDDGITVHQGISPNGDGINDFLQIENIANFPDNKLSIMNRDGQLVFEAKGYNNATHVFDGHSNKNGQMQLPGTYFYELDYTVSGVVKHKTGFLVLKY